MEIELRSPAKINLTLSITGRRSDGFHELVSLVAPLSFGDVVELSVDLRGSGIVLESNVPELPTGEANIAWRAAERFMQRFQLSGRVAIRIEKKIPIGAGLGGGSSNAAAALRGLSDLFNIEDQSALESLALELGSDCPLFLRDAPVIMRGRGDRIEQLNTRAISDLSGRRIALFKPPFGISTAWAYETLAAGKGGYVDPREAEDSLNAWLSGSSSLGAILSNSFESVVGGKYPSLPLLLNRLRDETGASCLMSGSGSCCFAICDATQEKHIGEIVEACWGKQAFFESTTMQDIGLTED